MKRFGLALLLLIGFLSSFAAQAAADSGLTVIRRTEQKETDVLHFTGTYPQISGMADEKAQAALNDRLRQWEQTALARAQTAVLTSGADDRSDVVVEALFQFEEKRNSGGLISLLFCEYLYTGVGSGHTTMTGLTFSSASGRVLKLKDLFYNENAMRNYLDKAIQEQLESRGLLSALQKSFQGITGEESFYLTDRHLVVLVQENDWFPPSMGWTEFVLSLDDMVPYLHQFVQSP